MEDDDIDLDQVFEYVNKKTKRATVEVGLPISESLENICILSFPHLFPNG